MATISRRVDSSGNISFQVKVRRAGQPAVSRTFPSKALAQQWAAEQEHAAARGAMVDPSLARGTTVGALMRRYLAEVTPHKKGASQEAGHMQPLLRSKLPAYTPASLTPAAVREFRDDRLREAAPSTVNRQLNLLSHVLEHARKEWGIGTGLTNPVSEVSRPKNGPPRDRRLSNGEEARLLDACEGSRAGYLADVVRLAIETGMRQAELVGLDWSRIDLQRCTARLVHTKNGEARTVPLSRAAIAILERRRATSGPVWPGVTCEGVKQAWQRACDRAQIEGLRFHDLRHEATSRFFEKGLNVIEAASVTGHKDLRMLKRYTHLDASKLAAKLG